MMGRRLAAESSSDSEGRSSLPELGSGRRADRGEEEASPPPPSHQKNPSVRLRIAAYNFLVGGSRTRMGHWSRVIRGLGADVVLAQECYPPESCYGERFRPGPDDALIWRRAAPSRWGSALFVKSSRLEPIILPHYEGWIVGGEIRNAPWLHGRVVRIFSIHGPAGERGYVRTLHEILDRLAVVSKDVDLILGGDFNVAVGYRKPTEKPKISRGELEILERLSQEFQLVPCWQASNPGRPLAQTLRWTGDRTTPYHCDGIFVPRSWQDRLVSCRVVKGSRWHLMSDHNPVLAEFAVEPLAG